MRADFRVASTYTISQCHQLLNHLRQCAGWEWSNKVGSRLQAAVCSEKMGKKRKRWGKWMRLISAHKAPASRSNLGESTDCYIDKVLPVTLFHLSYHLTTGRATTQESVDILHCIQLVGYGWWNLDSDDRCRKMEVVGVKMLNCGESLLCVCCFLSSFTELYFCDQTC